MSLPSVLHSTAVRALILYLLPSIACAAVLIRFARGGALWALLCLPATVVHELLHFVVGHLVRARPTKLSVWPYRAPGGVCVYGMVGFENIRWWNAAPAALAPLLGLPMSMAAAWWRIRTSIVTDTWDFLVWLMIAQLLAGSLPSRTDWRLAGRSWPLFTIGCIAAAAYSCWSSRPHP